MYHIILAKLKKGTMQESIKHQLISHKRVHSSWNIWHMNSCHHISHWKVAIFGKPACDRYLALEQVAWYMLKMTFGGWFIFLVIYTILPHSLYIHIAPPPPPPPPPPPVSLDIDRDADTDTDTDTNIDTGLDTYIDTYIDPIQNL